MKDYLFLGLCVTCHCGLVHLLYTLYSTTKMFYIRAFLSSIEIGILYVNSVEAVDA